MANVHLFLQAKGGVGKSFSAVMLTNYKLDCTDIKPVCIDTDPSNATYSAYPRFEAKRIDIMKGELIDSLRFDKIVQIIEKASGDDTVIIDNGASSFIAFADYILSNDVPSLLHEMGHQLYINTIVTGGDSQSDTVHGFASLARHFTAPARFIVWLNPYHGPIEYDGKSFENFRSYQDNKHMVYGIVTIPQWPQLHATTLGEMLKARLTFAEAIESQQADTMSKQRLKIVQRAMYEQLDAIPEI